MKRLILLGLTSLALVTIPVRSTANTYLQSNYNSNSEKVALVAPSTPSVPPIAIREMATLGTVGLITVNHIRFGPAPAAPAADAGSETSPRPHRRGKAPPVAIGQVSFDVASDAAMFYSWFRSATAPEQASRLKPQTITLLYYDIDGNLVGQTNLVDTMPVSEQPSGEGQSSTFTFNYASFNSSSNTSRF